jgi:class 3 adenylate cyclase/DNA-binding CsgD family transcriptional regulator
MTAISPAPASATAMETKAAGVLDGTGMPLFASSTLPARVRYRSRDRLVRPSEDRIITTVLFTDIVGSTQRAAELGDRRWSEVLAQHDRLVERELARHRGRLVSSMGDGMLARFDSPARAVRCAVALSEAARRIGLELRAGVHTGECEVRGGDVAGIAVHIGARVQAAARPSEVLVSSVVRDLVAGSGLDFLDRGRRVLKGVPDEWTLFAVVGDAQRPRPAPPAAGAHDGDELSELSRRELEVLEQVAEGRTNEEIAARLYLSNRTVERHLSNTYAKLRISGKAARAAAAARFSRAGELLLRA